MGKGAWGLQNDEAPLGLTLPNDVNPPPQGGAHLASPNSQPRQLTDEELAASQTFLPVESGTKYQYNFETRKWDQFPCRFQIAKGYFARGVTRIAFHMKVYFSEGDEPIPMVAKFLDSHFLVPFVGPITKDMLFHDATGQVVAGELAYEFNLRNPPRPIHFLPIFIIEFSDRYDRPMAFLEPRLPNGLMVKHNNNNGVVLSPFQTPQAFGHFTWEITCGNYAKFRRVVVDMQGVGDVYTDPQIHTIDHQGFGIGNQGKEGVRKFISGHTCNLVCLSLGLVRLVNGKKGDPWPAPLRAQVIAYQSKIKIPPRFDPHTGASIDVQSSKPMIGFQPVPIDPNWVDHIPQRMPILPNMQNPNLRPGPPNGPHEKPVSAMADIAWIVFFILLSLTNVCGWGVARTIDKECSKEFPYIPLFMQVQGIVGTVSGGIGLLAFMMARGPGTLLMRICAALAVFNGGWISCGGVWAFGKYVNLHCEKRIGFQFMWWMVILEILTACVFIYLIIRRNPSTTLKKMIIPSTHAAYSAVPNYDTMHP